MTKKKRVAKTSVKIAYGKKLFAQITNQQVGRDFSIMDKVLNNVYKGLDSALFEEKKLATDTLIKLLPFVLPREANGSQLNLQINNNGTQKTTTETVIHTLSEFVKIRMDEVIEVKERAINKNAIELKEIEVIEPTEDED